MNPNDKFQFVQRLQNPPADDYEKSIIIRAFSICADDSLGRCFVDIKGNNRPDIAEKVNFLPIDVYGGIHQSGPNSVIAFKFRDEPEVFDHHMIVDEWFLQSLYYSPYPGYSNYNNNTRWRQSGGKSRIRSRHTRKIKRRYKINNRSSKKRKS